MQLIPHYDRNEIAQALRINHAQLKERIQQQGLPKQQDVATLIECQLPIPASIGIDCALEFTCKNGSTVKITGLTATTIKPLVSLFIGE